MTSAYIRNIKKNILFISFKIVSFLHVNSYTKCGFTNFQKKMARNEEKQLGRLNRLWLQQLNEGIYI